MEIVDFVRVDFTGVDFWEDSVTYYYAIYLHTGALGWMIKDLKSDLNSIATNGMFVIDNFFNHALMVECKCQYLLPK